MIEARLTDELKLILFDTEKNKEVKSFPKSGIDPVKREAAEAKYKLMKQNIRQTVAQQKDLLKKAFLSGEVFPVISWKTDYLKNPVLKRIAQLLVWQQGEGNQRQYFTINSDILRHEDKSPYAINDSPIRLAHPIEMTNEQICGWQHYFLTNNLKQLFAQVWEPIAYRNIEDVKKDRYAGMTITVGHILGLENQSLVSYKFNSYGPKTIYTFADCMQIEGEIQSGARWLTENGPKDEIILGEISNITDGSPRKLNRVIAYLDRLIIPKYIQNDDDQALSQFLPGKTLAQIQDYLVMTIQGESSNCRAMLLDYKQTHFSDFPETEEFYLE